MLATGPGRCLMTLVFGAGLCFAQKPAPRVYIANTEQRTIASSKIGRRYDLFMSLPQNYATSKQSYPVLYVLDGWHFPLMAFIQDNSAFSGRMPPVIIVNVGQSPARDAMTLRARDFTPMAEPQKPNSGGGPAFLDFLENELIPFIDATYRTNRSDRGLLGHSLGASFALYALEQRPHLFQRIVAASLLCPLMLRSSLKLAAYLAPCLLPFALIFQWERRMSWGSQRVRPNLLRSSAKSSPAVSITASPNTQEKTTTPFDWSLSPLASTGCIAQTSSWWAVLPGAEDLFCFGAARCFLSLNNAKQWQL